MYVRTTVLVTNLAVHLKRGKDNALVWVTALDSGKPVAGAEVRVSDCDGKSLWRGQTDAQGRALDRRRCRKAHCEDASFLFASARLGEDYSFVRSDWNEGIEPWRFGVETWGELRGAQDPHRSSTARLFRAGQTVSMKHIARERNSRGFALSRCGKACRSALVIRHDGSGDEFRQPLELGRAGRRRPASGRFPTRPSAAPTRSNCAAREWRRQPAAASSACPTSACRCSPAACRACQRAGGAERVCRWRWGCPSSTAVRPRAPRSGVGDAAPALAELQGYDGLQLSSSISTSGTLGAFAVDDGRERETPGRSTSSR